MDDLNSPATKGDIREVVDGAVSQLRSEMQHQYDDLKDTMRDVQTEILKAFYGYTQTTDIKLKETEQSDCDPATPCRR